MLTKNEFIKKLKEARASQLLYDHLIAEIFLNYDLKGVPFKSNNSDNLREDILWYIYYGEMPLSENLDGFFLFYKKFVK